MPLIERTKVGSKNVVVLKYAAVFYYLMWPTIIVSFWDFGKYHSLVAFIMWIVLIGIAIPMWPVISEIKRNMKIKSILAKGSKYSFKNPLTYEWED